MEILIVILNVLAVIVFIADIFVSRKLMKVKIQYTNVLEKQNKLIADQNAILWKSWRLVWGMKDEQEKADEDNKDGNKNL